MNDDRSSSTDNLVVSSNFVTDPSSHPRIFFTHVDDEDQNNETSEIISNHSTS
jgi:hypothetical protein